MKRNGKRGIRTIMAVILCVTATQVRAGGIRTDRLTGDQRLVWQAILDVVEARNPEGQPLHPELVRLWEEVARSPHILYIEMPRDYEKWQYWGAQFLMEPSKGEVGPSRVGVIRLNPDRIDRDPVREEGRRQNGLLPFEKLKAGTLRYVEVMSHELAHALQILSHPEYERMVEELDRESDLLSRLLKGKRGKSFPREFRERRMRVQSLTRQIESAAEEAEAKVWRELVRGQDRPAHRPASSISPILAPSREEKDLTGRQEGSAEKRAGG